MGCHKFFSKNMKNEKEFFTYSICFRMYAFDISIVTTVSILDFITFFVVL